MRVILILFNSKWPEKIEESHSDEIKYVAWSHSRCMRRIELLGLVIEVKVMPISEKFGGETKELKEDE